MRRFSWALADKLAAAEKKYGYSDGWSRPDWMDECRQHLLEHVAKGDPRDVAAYCAFLWHHGASTAAPSPAPHGGDELAPAIATGQAEDWMKPTTKLQRMGDAMQLLCGGKRPSEQDLIDWLDPLLDASALQEFAIAHGPGWCQGIALIDAAQLMVDQPVEGVDHE